MSIDKNPLNALKLAVLQAVLAPLTNIAAAVSNVEANPNVPNLMNQIAIIKGQELTLALELPALLPTLEGTVIAAGAQEINSGLSSVIAEIEAQIAAAQPVPSPVPTAASSS